MAKRNRTPRQRRVVPRRTVTLLRPFLRWSDGRKAWVLRFVGNSIGPVYVIEGEGIKGKGPEAWATPPIPLDDYTDDLIAGSEALADPPGDRPTDPDAGLQDEDAERV